VKNKPSRPRPQPHLSVSPPVPEWLKDSSNRTPRWVLDQLKQDYLKLLQLQERLRVLNGRPVGQLKQQGAACQQEEQENPKRAKQKRVTQKQYDRKHILPSELVEKMITHLKEEKKRNPHHHIWDYKTKIAGEGIVFLQKQGARIPDKRSGEPVAVTDKQTKTVIRILEDHRVMVKLMS
jgi:hypothetical protein